MKSLSDFSLAVEEAIAARDYAARNPENLYQPIAYGLLKGGKRLRPVLLLMTAEAFGLNIEKALKPALGIEMFHNFTLLHDDVMDRSDLRRGRPTVHCKWDENTAILSGDAMLTLATQLMMEVEQGKLRSVLEIFNFMAMAVYEGQRLDMDFEKKESVSVDDYIDMIRKKTSALLAASSQIGAIIAGANEKDAMLMYEFGINLGLAFQIQDDYLDMFGDPATFGKPIGGDVLNEKKTFLTVNVTARGGADAAALADAMKIADGELRIRTVRSIYERAGIPELCRETIASYSRKALKSVRKTSLSDEMREPLERLLSKMIDRKK